MSVDDGFSWQIDRPKRSGRLPDARIRLCELKNRGCFVGNAPDFWKAGPQPPFNSVPCQWVSVLGMMERRKRFCGSCCGLEKDVIIGQTHLFGQVPSAQLQLNRLVERDRSLSICRKVIAIRLAQAHSRGAFVFRLNTRRDLVVVIASP